MPRNPTTGIFTRVDNSFSNPITGTVIDPTDASELFTDYDNGLTFDDGEPLILIGSASGVTTVVASDVASGTLTLPAATDTLVGRATTDVLTNKSMSGASNTFTDIPLATAVTGDLPFSNIEQAAAYSLLGNATGATADINDFTIGGLTQKVSPAATDLVLIQDQAAGGALKYSEVSAVAAAGSVSSLNGQVGALTLVAPGTTFNLGIAATVAANALTVAIKDAAGNNPSASSPVVLSFRNATVGTGTPSTLTISSAASIVVSSGSTLGTTNNTPFHLLVVGFNDGGTFRMGIINSSASGVIYPVVANGIASSTAEGGAGAADSAGVFYTGTAVTSKAYVVLARLTWGANPNPTAGTWANAPDSIELVNANFKYPGEVVQSVASSSGALASGTTVVARSASIPTNTEGDQYFSQAITPTSHANWLAVESTLQVTNSVVSWVVGMLFRDSTTNAFSAADEFVGDAGTGHMIYVAGTVLAASVATTTFKTRGGTVNAGTFSIGGNGGVNMFGGTMLSYLQVSEIQG